MVTRTALIWSIIISLILGGIIGYAIRQPLGSTTNSSYETNSPSTDNTNNGSSTSGGTNSGTSVGVTAQIVGPGEHCGGNMMNAPVCQNGYHCAATPGSTLPFGDVGGTCVADMK